MKTMYLITGPAGVGKSTISKILANSLEKSVLIEGDDIYHLVVSSYQSPWKEGNHLEFSWKNSLDLISNSLEYGYDVVFNYIIMKDSLSQILKRFKNRKDVKIKFVVLMTDAKSLRFRDDNRDEDCRMGERVLVLLKEFEDEGFDKQFVLDSSKLDAESTAKQILKDDRFVINF